MYGQSGLYANRQYATGGMGQAYGTDGTGNPGGANNAPPAPMWNGQDQFRNRMMFQRLMQQRQAAMQQPMLTNAPSGIYEQYTPWGGVAPPGPVQPIFSPNTMGASADFRTKAPPQMAKPMPAVQGKPPFDEAFNQKGRRY